MQLIPTLPIWLLSDLEAGVKDKHDDDENLVSSKLMVSIMVRYHNTLRNGFV